MDQIEKKQKKKNKQNKKTMKQKFDGKDSWKEEFINDKEIMKLINQQMENRENFMNKTINKHIRWYDRPLFFIYKKLATYFGTSQRIKLIQQRDGFNNTRFGVIMYGKEYWLDEKQEISL